MSTSAISSAHVAPPVAAPKAANPTAPKAPNNAAAPANPSASVAGAAISAAVAALKEATETSAQTAKEAAGGDRQAQRLLAKQAAVAAAPRGSAPETVGTHIDVKA
jgi:hypothetical protein